MEEKIEDENYPLATTTEKTIKHVVAYDIPKDKLRKQVASKLTSYGMKRIQYSLFCGSLSQNIVEMICKELGWIVGEGEGDIRLFYVCPHRETNQIVVRKRKNAIGEKMESQDVVVL